eukprot:RCo014137
MNRRKGGAVNYYQRAVRFRRQLSEIYNKTREDFASLRDYNDYLEEVETIVYNLTHEIDEHTMRAKIEAYKRDNLHFIHSKQAKQAALEALPLAPSGAVGGSSAVITKLPNPIDPAQAARFMSVVQQGYRVGCQPASKAEVTAGGFGDYFWARAEFEASPDAGMGASSGASKAAPLQEDPS